MLTPEFFEVCLHFLNEGVVFATRPTGTSRSDRPASTIPIAKHRRSVHKNSAPWNETDDDRREPEPVCRKLSSTGLTRQQCR
ncbi:hypothetical protein SNOG_04396 [Parastagonospora nodorum SN15]|uniref:Uncharacterized protein n=1 Tax=Phaeosphaeria nodorum (strain SN15 / ATCC MYA-4574 / FGSC 10173) TaxID=321614 RepID=Q0UV18_PHANO|nr:hypothetical protein SNOG_04396 [Parastagonospora nodorum SN15]EAT88156.1 hypothetical protein SNOG_04396 [Parastagonospora nodorum SN15]